jgi:Secretory lipase
VSAFAKRRASSRRQVRRRRRAWAVREQRWGELGGAPRAGRGPRSGQPRPARARSRPVVAAGQGYSGGAQATLFAAEQQPAYAPELNIVGAAAGAAGVDTISSPQMFEDGNLLSGIPFGAVIGVSRGFPDVDLLGVLTPQGQAMVAAAADMTSEQLVMSFPFVRCSDHLTVPAVLEIPGMRAAFEASRLGQATPSTAMHLYHAVHDKYPAIADVDKLGGEYRRQGANVTYRRFRFGGHVTVALTGVPGALRFLSERFGSPVRRREPRARHRASELEPT